MKDLTLPTPALPPLADEIFHAVDNAMYAAGISAADRRFVMDSVNASASVRAALSHHEDGGRAEPVWCSCGDAIMPDTGAKCGVCASGVALGGEPPCNPHPDAPHGYNRNASHNAGRYVCDCEGWAALGGGKRWTNGFRL